MNFLNQTSVAHYPSISGNLGASLSVRDIDSVRSEIVVISYWDSLESIEAFAGIPSDNASYYPEDDPYLLTRPEKALHYDLEGLQTRAIKR